MLRHVGIRYKSKQYLNIVSVILLLCIIYNSECLPSPKHAGIFLSEYDTASDSYIHSETGKVTVIAPMLFSYSLFVFPFLSLLLLHVLCQS